MNRLFEIQTLSNKQYNLRDYSRLGFDPFSVILGAIPGILNLFSKTPLSRNDLNQIFPGNGYWTSNLKNHLMQHIAWKDENLPTNIDVKMKAYIGDVYRRAKCMDLPGSCFDNHPYPGVDECPECTNRFYKELQNEKLGTNQNAPYPTGGFNYQTLLLVGGGVLLLLALNKKKSRKK